MRFNNLRTSMAVAALISLAISGAARADEMEVTVKSTTSSAPADVPTGTTITTTTTNAVPGGVVYFRTAEPTVLVTTLQGRRKSLEEQIDQARNRGAISEKKAERMKRELKRIDAETNASSLTYPKAVMFARDLDLIGAQYGTIVTTAPVYVPIIAGSHFTVYNGQILQLDDLSVRRIDLETRVINDVLEGRMNETQAANIRAKLDTIGNEQAFYNADGNLNFKQAEHLYREFDRVATDIEKIAGKDN